MSYEQKVAGWKGNRMSDTEDENRIFGSRPSHNAGRIRSSNENEQLRSRIDSSSNGSLYRESLVTESIGMTEKWVAEDGHNVKSGRNVLGFEICEFQSIVAYISSNHC